MGQIEKIIIFQPGSLNFYFGTPSQALPYCFPSVVAFRNSKADDAAFAISGRSKYKFDNADFSSLEDMAKSLNLLNRNSTSVFDFGQSAFNDQQKVIMSDLGSDVIWLDVRKYSDIMIGDNVLNMDPAEARRLGYEIRWIFEDLSCIEDRTLSEQEKCLMGKIFLEAIATVYPKLPVSSYDTIKFILLIPDSFNRDLILGMLDVMFRHVNLQAGTLLQESVAVSYFLRSPKVCVVDIGHRKISVSCVEEGISLPHSRIWLNYGCDLIMETFYNFWKSIKFPLNNLSPSNSIHHWKFLQTQTFKLCHLLKDVTPGAEFKFTFSEPCSKVLKFTSKFGDEPLLSALSFFSEAFLKSLNFVTGCLFRYNDLHSRHELLDDEHFAELSSIEQLSRASNPGADKKNTPKGEAAVDQGISIELRDGVIPLDEAVYKSISASGGIETRAKYFSNIVVVGCGANIAGMDEFLKKRLTRFIPRGKGLKSSAIEVTTTHKDCASEHVAWKGACIAVGMQCFSDFLIESNQWENKGVTILREKSIFELIPGMGAWAS